MKKVICFMSVCLMLVGSMFFASGCSIVEKAVEDYLTEDDNSSTKDDEEEKEEGGIGVSVKITDLKHYFVLSSFTLEFTNNSTKSISSLEDVDLLFINKNNKNKRFFKNIAEIRFSAETVTYVCALSAEESNYVRLTGAQEWEVAMSFSNVIFS